MPGMNLSAIHAGRNDGFLARPLAIARVGMVRRYALLDSEPS